MSYKAFGCRQCGNCCINVPGAYSNSVFIEDVHMWEQNGRKDILAWVVRTETGYGSVLYNLWFDPETGKPAAGCPWLNELPDGKYSCLIHDVKPRHCRDWPDSRQAARSYGCPAV